MAETVVVRRRWGLPKGPPWSVPTLLGFGVWIAAFTGWAVSNNGPIALVLVWPVIGFAVTTLIPRRVFEADAAGVLVGRGSERLSWGSITEVLVVDSGDGRSWVGLRRPQAKSRGLRGRLDELATPPRHRPPAGELSVLRLELDRRATLDGTPVEPRRLAERLEEVARVPVRLVVAGDHGHLRVRGSFRSVVGSLALVFVWVGGVGSLLLRGLGAWVPGLGFTVVFLLMLVEYGQPPVVAAVERDGLWLGSEYLPWDDIEAVAVAPDQIEVRLRSSEEDVRRRVKVDAAAFAGAVQAYARVDVVGVT